MRLDQTGRDGMIGMGFIWWPVHELYIVDANFATAASVSRRIWHASSGTRQRAWMTEGYRGVGILQSYIRRIR